MKFFITRGLVVIGLFSLFSCLEQKAKKSNDFNLDIESLYISYLDSAILSLDQISNDQDSIGQSVHYINARKFFKRIEPILSFMESENFKTLNGPNILKVHEEDATDIKIKKPRGFQVIEETLFSDSVDVDLLVEQIEFTKNRLTFIKNNTDLSSNKCYHYIWMIRRAVSRIALTGVTGFDSPVLENSTNEAVEVYIGIGEIIRVLESQFTDKVLYKEWERSIDSAIAVLKSEGFNEFDRYAFIKEFTHPQLVLTNKTAKDWSITYPFTLALHNDVESLFASEAFNANYFSGRKGTKDTTRVLLGQRLFNDKHLSIDNNMSCATCHQESLGFTDGLSKPKGQSRNSPTLLYAALQQKFFYDGRSGSLEGQIVSVVNNTSEFHSSLDSLVATVKKNKQYVSSFSEAYKDGVTNANVRNAIADYVRELTPFDSKFDRNINGLESTLTQLTSSIRKNVGFSLRHQRFET